VKVISNGTSVNLESQTYDIDPSIPSNSYDGVERAKVHPNNAHFGGVTEVLTLD